MEGAIANLLGAVINPGDEVIIRTWVHDLQRYASRRKFVICRPVDQAVLARGTTRWVFVDLRNHRVLRIPDDVASQLTVLDENAPLPWASDTN